MLRSLPLALLLTGCDVPWTSDHATDDDLVDTDDVVTDQGRPEDWPGGRHAVAFENALGESIRAVLVLPEGTDRVPLAMVLHGSGGLFEDVGTFTDFDPASARMERPFREWESLIAPTGAAVLFPASFASRGSFDWNDDPIDGWDKPERLRRRALDAAAAWEWACRNPRLDCDRSAVFGFSNGGSATLLSTSEEVADNPEFEGAHPVTPTFAMAWYPGCGLHGFVPLTSGTFTSTAPLVVAHGEDDSLLENCLTRVEQARDSGSDIEHLRFDDVGHSFDASPDDDAEEAARDDMRDLALEWMGRHFAP